MTKPVVKAKIRTVDKLKKYCEEPKCLRCGYDLRGFGDAQGGDCPECGQDCRRVALVEQIAGQRWDRLPVLNEIKTGVTVLLAMPVFVGLTSSVTAMLLSLVGFGLESGGWIFIFWFGAFTVLWILTSLPAYRAVGDVRGCVYWVACHLIVGLYLVALAGPAWMLIVLVVNTINLVGSVFDGDRYDPDTLSWLSDPWVYVFAGGGAGLFIGLRWLSSRLLVNPCRARCRYIAKRWLAVTH